MPTQDKGSSAAIIRLAVVAFLILGAFFISYRFAAARSSQDPSASGFTQAAYAPADAGSGAACACCGTGASSEPIEGAAVLEGDVQRLTVDTSSGGYDPNVIKLKAGVPAEITFGQASGCLAQVMSQDLGFFEDLTGGPRTVRLPALDAGEYGFSCGMQMVFGTIVVQ